MHDLVMKQIAIVFSVLVFAIVPAYGMPYINASTATIKDGTPEAVVVEFIKVAHTGDTSGAKKLVSEHYFERKMHYGRAPEGSFVKDYVESDLNKRFEYDVRWADDAEHPGAARVVVKLHNAKKNRDITMYFFLKQIEGKWLIVMENELDLKK